VITVSPAEPGDAAAIAALLADLGRFYGTTEAGSLDQRLSQIHEAIFTSPPAAHALLARDTGSARDTRPARDDRSTRDDSPARNDSPARDDSPARNDSSARDDSPARDDNDSQVAGLATYSFVWPARGVTRSLYMKELYVAGAYRGQGVGKLLMRAIFDVAAQRGCSRVEWTTDTDNPVAQAFYAKLGLSSRPSKIFYRVEDTGSGLPSL
jgi:ribosomal protein S18 acetylase RimI-like enzyme